MNYIIGLLTMVMLWGCMTFRYVGNGFSIGAIAFVLLVCIITWKKRKWSFYRLHTDLVKALLSLYGVVFLVSLFQYDTIKNITDSAYSSVTLLMITLPLWMVVYMGYWYDIRKWIIYVVYGNMYAFTLYGIFMYLAQKQDRLVGFYGSAPEAGMLLDLFIPFTMALTVFLWKRIYWRIISLILVVLEVVAVLLTETRGSYLALCAGLVVFSVLYVWMNWKELAIWEKVGAGLIAVLICVTAGSYTMLLGSESVKRMEGGERLLMWESSYHMWEDHKWLGIGLSEWKETYNNPESKYHPDEAEETTNVMPHNIYIYFGATGGIVSLLGLCGYMFFMSRYLLRKIHMQKNNPMGWAMLVMFVALMAHGLVDGTLISKHIGRVFYLLIGAGIVFTEIYNPDKSPDNLSNT